LPFCRLQRWSQEEFAPVFLQWVAHDALIERHERPWTPRFFLDASSSLLLEAKLAVGRARLAAAASFLCNSVPTTYQFRKWNAVLAGKQQRFKLHRLIAEKSIS
jgi:hypothetical protein